VKRGEAHVSKDIQELRHSARGVIKDVEELKRIFQMMVVVLNQLGALGIAKRV
jgi:hypothetical protein